MRLENKRMIVTGASRGIGRVMAQFFAREGASVVISARNEKELKAVEEEICSEGGDVFLKIADMSRKDEIKDLVEYTVKQLGSVDVLVNNAGLPMFGCAIDDPADFVEDRFNQVIDTNFKGYWYAARYVIPYMRKQKSGNIINISSVRGHLGLANESAYCGVKGAINMFTKALAVEAAHDGVRVNTISPGAIQTEAVGHWIRSRYGREAQKEYAEKFGDVFEQGMLLNQPMNIVGQCEDVAHAAVFIASDEARFITGSDLLIDGGLTSLLAEPPALDLEGLSSYYQNSREMRKWLSALDNE
ncbi:glucose 1-dehydrogenase [Marispirochaeta aestuarii]|uniref:SDR family NAD(P)-dependent oxidoreductase n=1 Tax=Marispirochaeta aestuarii TaxID=1963862 RepID=UPI002ABDD906|nr:glucose 1-dehydrogenase [Marispirochaeta aestuarii]